MNRKEIIVPAGIRYISEWAKHQDSPFSIPDHPCIIDKGLTGCGFTEYCINPQYNSENIILCSPRRILLKNKHEQQTEQGNNVYIVRNDYEKVLDVDKNLNSTSVSKTDSIPKPVDPGMSKEYHLGIKDGIKNYINECINFNLPAKILVTYDSFRIVREVIESDMNLMQYFRVVIDEFQSIFTDASFKADIGLELVQDHLAGIQKLCYVSATPMMDEYLEELIEFKNLPLYVMDWKSSEPSRVIRPELKVSAFSGQSLMAIADKIIQTYKDGDYKVSGGVQSKEVIFYVNSVRNIRDIVRKSDLKPDQVNIICSDTPGNRKYLKRYLGKAYEIGKVPTRNEPRKMFTLCTRTVYLGADFYSDNARTIILSDANIRCLAVDITLDLPQIMGRQRLDANPWKNRAELHAKLPSYHVDEAVFLSLLDEKDKESEGILANMKVSEDKLLDPSLSQAEIDTMKRGISAHLRERLTIVKNQNYMHNYVTVKKHSGGNQKLCVNVLVKLADKRAFDIQKMNYADRFQLFSSISSSNCDIDAESKDINDFLDNFPSLSNVDKYRSLCTIGPTLSEDGLEILLKQIPTNFGEHYRSIGPKKILATGCNVTFMNKYLHDLNNPFKPEDLDSEIYSNFSEGQRISCTDAKDILKTIYQNNDIQKGAMATDLCNYFETKSMLVTSSDKSRVRGLKLIKKLR